MSIYTQGSSNYSVQMREKIKQYNSLVLRAEILRRDNGKPTKEEAMRYSEAAKVCEEIMNLNLSERSVHEQWYQNKLSCSSMVQQIVSQLAPKVESPQETASAAQPQSAPSTTAEPKQSKAPTTTATGFQTKNAIKEVPAETIESWFKTQPDHGLDDLVGMEEQKELLRREAANLGWERTDDALSISPTQRYFFYGLPGTGKTYLIEAFAHDMMKLGFSFIHLKGSEIHSSLVGVAEKTVQIAFQEAIDHAPSIVFIDEIENVCSSRGGSNAQSHERHLTVAFLEALNTMKNSGKRIVFIGATNYPRQVDAAMRDRVHMVCVPLPSEEVRAKYFHAPKKLGMLPLDDDLTYEYMADQTDNFSFRDLDTLIDDLKTRARARATDLFAVYDESSKLDLQKTDAAAAEAIRDGKVKLNFDLFTEAMNANPPAKKRDISEELEKFEREID